MEKDFETLVNLSKQTHTLSSIERLLFWDQETMMPEGAIDIKSMQQKELASIIHAQKTSKEYGALLEKLFKASPLDANLKLMHKDYIKQLKLPASFITELAEVSSKATHAWMEARKKNNFKSFEPHLEKIIALMQKRADYLGYEAHPYDALLDEYEPEMTVSKLDALFTPLKRELTDITHIASKKKAETHFLEGDFDIEVQKKLGHALLEAMGINKKFLRLDHSAHPFCMAIHPTDIRLTTHFKKSGFFDALSATMHEGGHGLYEQGLKAENFGLPSCEAVSMGMHESQSKLWETFIGMSMPFWKGYYPTLQEAFPKQLQNISLNSFYQAINLVKPSLIRIHADEVTYGLHVILRYEIEKGFMEGKIKVKDLPDIWNHKMKEFLGVTPDSDANGCMQDIHWSSALFGYFPTYALGNLYAAQLHSALKRDLPNFDSLLEAAEYAPITKWLHDKVHIFGRTYAPEALIEKATGGKVTSAPFISYLRNKYLS
jgi:carboxypeptidase Taq